MNALFQREAKLFLLGFDDLFASVLQHPDSFVREGQRGGLKRDVRYPRCVPCVVKEFIDHCPGLDPHRGASGVELLGGSDPHVRVKANQQGQGGIAEFLAQGVNGVGVHVCLLAMWVMVIA
jgi:hypothetical protein